MWLIGSHSVVTCLHQLTANLAKRKMLTCFTFRSYLAFSSSYGGGENRMASYRVYLVDADGHFSDVIALDCANDAEAIEAAKAVANGQSAELWQLARKVAVFPDSNMTRD
jgi:hypothetical protein